MNSQKENVLSSLLKKIDIFSVGVGFNIKQNENIKLNKNKQIEHISPLPTGEGLGVGLLTTSL